MKVVCAREREREKEGQEQKKEAIRTNIFLAAQHSQSHINRYTYTEILVAARPVDD